MKAWVFLAVLIAGILVVAGSGIFLRKFQRPHNKFNFSFLFLD
jgi:hypothetical protein